MRVLWQDFSVGTPWAKTIHKRSRPMHEDFSHWQVISKEAE